MNLRGGRGAGVVSLIRVASHQDSITTQAHTVTPDITRTLSFSDGFESDIAATQISNERGTGKERYNEEKVWNMILETDVHGDSLKGFGHLGGNERLL